MTFIQRPGNLSFAELAPGGKSGSRAHGVIAEVCMKLVVVALVPLLMAYAPRSAWAQVSPPNESLSAEGASPSSTLQRIAAATPGHRPVLQSPIVRVGRCPGETASCCCQINAGLSVCMPPKGCADVQGKCVEEARGCGE
jgi:hypothetical protein